MPTDYIIFSGLVFIFLFLLILRMIIKHQLGEVYAVVWMVVVFSIPLSILFYPLLLKISNLAGFISPSNFIFVVGFVALGLISLHFSALNSTLQNTLKNTVQKVALLEGEIEKLKQSVSSSD